LHRAFSIIMVALPESLVAAMQRVALEVASRLTEPARVEAALEAARRRRGSNPSVPWRDHGTANGYAGLSVFFGGLDRCFPMAGWDVTAHAHLRRAIEGVEVGGPLSLSLFDGLSGVVFACGYLSRGGTRYRKALAALDSQLLPRATAAADRLRSRGGGVAVEEFDLISGLTGVAAALLTRGSDPDARAVLENVLNALATLVDSESELPRWHTPTHLAHDGLRRSYPNGVLNCGLAHGIAGPLALLALATQADIPVEDGVAAMDRIVSWLLGHRVDDSCGVNWPGVWPIRDAGSSETADRPKPSHAGWCYGSAGVARSLWLAGRVLRREDACDLAVAAMEAIQKRSPEHRGLASATFCHGVAGLFSITLLFAEETGLSSFARMAEGLGDELLSLYSTDTPLCYSSVEANGVRVDHPGLLDGAPGVALVLASAAAGGAMGWERLFALA
jgi:hypothetical protein